MTDSILSETDWEILETNWEILETICLTRLEILEIHWQASEIGRLMDLKMVWILVLMDLVTGENRLLIGWVELSLI